MGTMRSLQGIYSINIKGKIEFYDFVMHQKD